MKRVQVYFIQLLITAYFCCYPDICTPDIYKFVDKKGTIHLTNMPNHNGYRVVLEDRKSAGYKENRYDNVITVLCDRHGVDVPLVKAVIKAESDFNPIAVSKKGAQGLMQLMPEKAEEFSVANPFDPYQNIDGGVRILRGLFDKFDGDISLVLAAYNAGENAVVRENGVPPFKETQNYIKKVLKYKKLFE
jgi:soluble lytic murein transglycosylase-like protein